MTQERLKIGEGKISGAIAIFLATLSLVGILCFKFPEYLTTPDFREVYTAKMVENLMLGAIIGSFGFALLSFLLSKSKKLAVIAIVIAAIAIVAIVISVIIILGVTIITTIIVIVTLFLGVLL